MPRRSYDINYHTDTKKYGTVMDCGVCHGSGIDHTISLVGTRCENCKGTGKVRV